MKRSKIGNKKVLFVLGTGLGYQIRTLLKRKNPDARIFAIEKHQQVFQKAVETQQWKDNPLEDDVEFIIGKSVEEVMERIHNVLENVSGEDVEVITNKPSWSLDPEYYKEILRDKQLAVDDL